MRKFRDNDGVLQIYCGPGDTWSVSAAYLGEFLYAVDNKAYDGEQDAPWRVVERWYINSTDFVFCPKYEEGIDRDIIITLGVVRDVVTLRAINMIAKSFSEALKHDRYAQLACAIEETQALGWDPTSVPRDGGIKATAFRMRRDAVIWAINNLRHECQICSTPVAHVGWCDHCSSRYLKCPQCGSIYSGETTCKCDELISDLERTIMRDVLDIDEGSLFILDMHATVNDKSRTIKRSELMAALVALKESN